jgi:hypothetical protein
MARTKWSHKTAAEKAAALAVAVEKRDAQCAAARRAKRTSWAAIDPPDDGLIQLLPTVHEAPSDHLTGRRRKTTLVLVVILATMAMGSRCALWKRERILWQDYCGSMLRSEFTRMFRMDPLTFAYLVGALSPRIDRNFVQAERAGGYISPELRVAMTIRWLAGGSYLDLKVHMGVATSTFYDIAEDVCDAIIETFPIKFDTSRDALKERAAEFALRQRPHMRVFRGVVGAIDGLLVKIRCPWKSEVGMPRTFFCRKGFFALSVQAVCDARKRFIFVSMDMPGSTHDARVFTMSALWEAIQLGYISQGFYLLGDAAYRGIQHILTPFIGNQTADESVFSFYHSSLRMCVECSFGILVARWGILWKPLKVSLRRAPKIVETCMCLHNVMIDRCVPQEIRPPVYSKSGRVTYRPHIDNNGAPTQLMTDNGAESTADCGGMTDLRSKLKSQMKELEMKRPQLAIERQQQQTTVNQV